MGLVQAKIILLWLLSHACLQLAAQVNGVAANFLPPAIAPVIYAVEGNENIIFNGKLKEAIWQLAQVINKFFRIEPGQGCNGCISNSPSGVAAKLLQ
jgi:hypothetical protein